MVIEKSLIQENINKGIRLFETNNFNEAIQIFNTLSKKDETKIIGLFFLGVIEVKKNNLDLAKNYFFEVLNINKFHEDANLNLGLVYLEEKKFDKSIEFFEKVLSINKQNLNALYHLGLSYFSLRELDQSIDYLNKSIQLNKKFIHAYVTLGHIYLRMKNFDKALENYKKVLEVDPKRIKTKFNISWCYFAQSNLDEAFENYEFRNEKLLPKGRYKEIIDKFKSLEWRGQNLNNKTLLIICEQGYGDNINFFRYLYWLNEKFSVKIIFYAHKRLEHLFKNSPFEIISNLDSINSIDYHQHLLSLPGIYYKELKGFQKNINYIQSSKAINVNLEDKLNKLKKPIIAINWQGDHRYAHDDMRSIPLIYFKNIINNKNYDFISLQKNFGSEQIVSNNFENLLVDLSKDIDNGKNAFEDTIEILKKVKCVITSDTAIAHLAGTMNVKTFLLLSYNPEWRWYIELKHKCFYTSINIIQQTKFGDWNSVFNELNNKLEKL